LYCKVTATATGQKIDGEPDTKLKAELEQHINRTFGRKSHSASILLQQLFINPVTDVNKVTSICSLSKKAANDLVADFVNANILKEMTGQNRNRIFIFDKYVNLF